MFVFNASVFSQVSDSPYTLFGAGQIQDYGFGTNKGMGGTGIAFKSERYLNNLNPASYAGIDSLNFIFEFGLFGNIARYETQNSLQKKTNGNIRYLAAGLRIYRWWGISAGIVPYSTVGYKIISNETIEGINTLIDKTYSGNGGINQVYLGNSFLVGRNLSLGINTSYLFGKITQSEKVSTNNYFNSYVLNNYYYIGNFHLDYGLQYSFTLNTIDYSLGVIFGNGKRLNTRNEIVLEVGYDTTYLEKEGTKFYIPARFGVGLGIVKAQKFKAGIDYEVNKWSSYEFSNHLLITRNSERFSAGAEYCPMTGYKGNGLKNWQYRAGFSYSESYLIINHTPVNSTSITLGLGIPLRNELSCVNLSFEAGEYGTLANSLIRERFLTIHLNFTLRDRWFEKSKYY